MATYRVYLALPRTPKGKWDSQQTIVADDERSAVAQAYANWATSRAPLLTPPLKRCRSEVWKVRQSTLLASAGAAESGKQAFIDEIQRQTAQLLATKLDGEFSVVSYPAGFNYGITYGPNAYWNGATMNDIDTLLGVSSSGQLELTGGGFSDLYAQLLQGVTFSFSQADEQYMQAQDNAASAQIASILREFENAGGVYNDPPPFGGKLQDVFDQLTALYGSLDKLPKSLNALRNAIAAYQSKAGDSYALHNRYYAATARIAAALDAATNPTKQNAGQQISAQSWVVGYTPDKLPTANQLIGSLNTVGNALKVVINLNDFSEESVQMSLSGGFEFPIPIGEFFDISIGASASYDMSRYASSSTSVTMDMTYPGVTMVAATPSRLSADNKTGWYANDILEEVATKTGQDATGYKLQGTEYDVGELFGPGMAFSRLKTFVISQQPTIAMTFSGTEISRITSDFKVGASIKLKLFGLFTLGEAEGSYSVHNVQSDSKTGTVTVTFGPPQVSGTTPLEKQVAYVLGGVASYPPDNI
ncbi:hypothetical protein [Ideonella sp. YS5]|uniref:hypothetical protein n=1 Tax=Ideonella sp. YS5 TaxID=3453714 RepID=UPI003EEC4971